MELQMLAKMIPKPVEEVLLRLKKNGHQAYLVGGCVRDLIQNIMPGDFDITTSALPVEVENMFSETHSVGKRFGTIIVHQDGCVCEVTTMRREGQYLDGRRPEEVDFTHSLFADLQRRDFTINALAFDGAVLFDLFMGLRDFHLKQIRCVGNPDQRFREDSLRLMRAVRFATELGFSIQIDTWQSLVKHSRRIRLVSSERIRNEFEKILLSNSPGEGLSMLEASGLLEHSGLRGHFARTNADPCYWAPLQRVDRLLVPRMAVYVLLIMGKEMILKEGNNRKQEEYLRDFLKELTFSEKTSQKIVQLVSEIYYLPYTTACDVRRMMNRIGKEEIKNIEHFLTGVAEIYGFTSRQVNCWKRQIHRVLDRKEATQIADLEITGRDLNRIGLTEGPLVGEMLGELLDVVLDNPKLNDQQVLLDLAKSSLETKKSV